MIRILRTLVVMIPLLAGPQLAMAAGHDCCCCQDQACCEECCTSCCCTK